MATTRKSLTQHEVSALQQWALDNHIITDDSTEVGKRQCEFLIDYFEKTWPVDVTPENLAKALPVLRPHLKFYSEIDQRAIRALQSNPAIVPAFDDWFSSQTILANVPNTPEANENIALLLEELRGRQVNETTVYQAIGRLQNKGANLHWTIKKQVHVDPRSHKATDDGKPFLGEVNVPLWKKIAAERERQDAERKSLTGQREPDAVRQARFKDIAEGILGNTHSQSDQIRRVFVTDSKNQIDWERTAAARKRLADSFSDRSIR